MKVYKRLFHAKETENENEKIERKKVFFALVLINPTKQ